MIKKVGFILVAILVIIQFIKPEKNLSVGAQPNNISTKYEVPKNVAQIFSDACYNCHSNHTKYPWYSNIQPLAWWHDDHIKDGKKHFNFDEFATYSLKKQDHKLEEMIESQVDHWMPMDSYVWMHPEADLKEEQRKLIIDWVNVTRKQIQNNPAFNILEKK
jgi:hypothetical protein